MSRLLDDVASDAHLKWTTDLPAGAPVVELAADDPLRLKVPAPVDRAAALAYANSGGAMALRVPANTELDRPAVVELHGTSVDDVVWGHVVVEIGANSTATVVIDHTGSASYSAMLSVLVGDGARLTLVNLQDWADDTVHVEHQAASVGRDATFTSAVVTLGGDLVRLTPDGSVHRPWRQRRAAGAVFRRCRASTSSIGCSSTTTSRTAAAG